MSRAVAWYFGILAAFSGAGVAVSGFEGSQAGYALAQILVWVALAVGLYKRYRVARMAAIVVCILGASIAMVASLLSGGLDPIFLLIVAVHGVPLLALLHPRSRIECVRRIRSAGAVTSDNDTQQS